MIEPTAQIIVRQNRVDQRRLPDEDAKSLVFDDTLLFDIDKFSGYDRFETGTRANVGLQYTFQANNGVYARPCSARATTWPARTPTPIRASTRPAKFNFSPVSGLETNRSDYVAGLYLSPFTGLQPDRARPLRREGLDAAPPGYDRCRQLRSAVGTAGYSFSHFDPTARPDRQPAGRLWPASGCG